jgi:predicted PhzF superfamily epimerase YddE/YHI9
VKALNPDFRRLLKTKAKAVIVTSRSEEEEYDFVSRFFAPAAGIDEDPVTGSAHCYLTPYWSEKLGKDRLVGYQASKRTGIIRCALEGDRVEIGGKSVTIFQGLVVI